MVISKKMNYLKADPSPKWMSRCVGLVYFQYLVWLSYELSVNGEKKVSGNWDIINKNGHSTFYTGKPGNFNSLLEVIWVILWHCYLEINWRWEFAKKKYYGY